MHARTEEEQKAPDDPERDLSSATAAGTAGPSSVKLHSFLFKSHSIQFPPRSRYPNRLPGQTSIRRSMKTSQRSADSGFDQRYDAGMSHAYSDMDCRYVPMSIHKFPIVINSDCDVRGFSPMGNFGWHFECALKLMSSFAVNKTARKIKFQRHSIENGKRWHRQNSCKWRICKSEFP